MDNKMSMYGYFLNNRTHNRIDAIRFFGRNISTATFKKEVDKLADYLASVGVVAGDSVAICLPNFPSGIIAFYATNKLGAIANVIHPLIPAKGLRDILDKIPSKVLFAYDAFIKGYGEALQSRDIVVVECGAQNYMTPLVRPFMTAYFAILNANIGFDTVKYSKILAGQYANAVEYTEDNIAERTACYLHSGGTTGTPKTVVLPNRALNACATNIISLIGEDFGVGDSMLMVLPMFHVFGLGVCMHSAISHNARCILVPKFSAKTLSKSIKRDSLTYMTGVPSMYVKLLNQKSFKGKKLQNLKYCYCGGDKLKQETIEQFHAVMQQYNSNCKLCEGYGLTEATVTNVNAPKNSLKGSVGLPIGGCRTAIFDSLGNPLPPDTRGEICIGGESVMSGYYNDAETTNRVLFEDDNCVWVRTGDIGMQSPDGHITFVDRKKRMLKISGVNVFPTEIESVVYDHVEEIATCCAIEKIIKSKPTVKLIVVLKQNQILDDKLKGKITREIGTRLMKYSVPKTIEERKSLPLTQIGKVDYAKLQNEERQQNIEN